MKKSILVICLLLLSLTSFEQNAKELLQESYSKCQTIKNGYFEMDKSMQWMNEKDTNSFNFFKYYFKKLSKDSLYPIAFNYQQFYNGQYFINVMYTVDEYVRFSSKDSTAQLKSNAKWAKEIMSAKHNDIFNFYSPFTSVDCSPLPKTADYTDNRHIFKFVANETLNSFLCYHIQMVEFPKYDSSKILNNLETVYDYWINIQDMIPVKYSFSSKVLSAGDTLKEYFSYSLKKYELNNLQDPIISLQLSAIPSYCNVQEYAGNKTLELLNKNTLAPNWTLFTLDNKKVTLSDYRGQLTLIDFFYSSCYPCMQALPVLQRINDKYKNKGLSVIGIDPIDSEENGIKHFLSKRGIIYTVLLDNKDVAKDYHISGYPTIYLIDKNGKIIFTMVGFGDETESILEENIKRNL